MGGVQVPQWVARFNTYVTNPVQRISAGWPSPGRLRRSRQQPLCERRQFDVAGIDRIHPRDLIDFRGGSRFAGEARQEHIGLDGVAGLVRHIGNPPPDRLNHRGAFTFARSHARGSAPWQPW
jgi:hypothetical protein